MWEGVIAKSIYVVLTTEYLEIQLGENANKLLGFMQAFMSRRIGIVSRFLDDCPIVLYTTILDPAQIFDILNKNSRRYQKFTMEMEHYDHFIPTPDIRTNKIPKTRQI